MPVLVALLLFAMGGLLTLWLIVRLWKRRKQVPWLASLGVVGLAGSWLIGGGGTLVGLVMAFGAVGGESIDPSQKARILAEGISEAPNYLAFGVALWIPSLLLALVVERTLATERGRGEPPSA
jgi:4-amino-4-deoxy-L-arabinose transferase-like glycosyltransferase